MPQETCIGSQAVISGYVSPVNGSFTMYARPKYQPRSVMKPATVTLSACSPNLSNLSSFWSNSPRIKRSFAASLSLLDRFALAAGMLKLSAPATNMETNVSK